MRTAKLAFLAFLLGAVITFTIAFPVRFLYVAYMHGGIF